MAVLFTVSGCVLIIVMIGIVFTVCLRHGLFIKVQYIEEDEHPEIVSEEPEAFFDEKDLAAMEAHHERPEFHGTVTELNGIRTGADGLPLHEEERRRSWLLRKLLGDDY